MLARDHWVIEKVGPSPKTQLGKFFWQIHIGLRFHYPPCCVVRFAWDYAVKRQPSGSLRGGIHRLWPDGAPHVWVPCAVFHRPDPGWEPNRGI